MRTFWAPSDSGAASCRSMHRYAVLHHIVSLSVRFSPLFLRCSWVRAWYSPDLANNALPAVSKPAVLTRGVHHRQALRHRGAGLADHLDSRAAAVFRAIQPRSRTGWLRICESRRQFLSALGCGSFSVSLDVTGGLPHGSSGNLSRRQRCSASFSWRLHSATFRTRSSGSPHNGDC